MIDHQDRDETWAQVKAFGASLGAFEGELLDLMRALYRAAALCAAAADQHDLIRSFDKARAFRERARQHIERAKLWA